VEQSAAGRQGAEATRVPEVPRAVLGQGRAGGRAAEYLQHHGRLMARAARLNYN
jgi:hypothetical protein